MEWLGIDQGSARNVARHLVACGATCNDAQARTAIATAHSGLGVDVTQLLDGLADRLNEIARALTWSADTIDGHVLRVAPRPDLPLVAAGQLASHNTYRSDRSLHELHDAGVTGFEFDLHGPGDAGEWEVYHHAFDRGSNVGSLSDALDRVAALPTGAPLTVFLDFKDAPMTRFDQQAFDQQIRMAFGDRLFTPLDLIRRSPGATTVGEAAAIAGWPTFAELSTSVLVIVTGDVTPYRARAGLTAAAFVAAAPTASAISDPHVTVYNAPSTDLSTAEVLELQLAGGLVRTWGRPTEAGRQSNYLALDV